ncbi:trypsin-like peptidase domain-containing protein [Sinorhizobium meliloti]|uniref:S1 family peptidase n=1 Tax=Rhizobium meliloti TaxID=382 RepID=UPI000B5A9F45|nr:serine protease [Sinorhizobium meliloti]ASJ59007.1 hypothetical protein SMB554_07250 [Sinorhizobium meliloti]MCK3783464.1 trypsin-like peptidase domain-containing protein [Sinorhizobium meliloti]MCK3787906.1 trypsin-like peptidase domain-containing protein [Sinorhizobium meliloti]MCK3794817.1 trypsin-like peptidase domain-containing protein [Sinorhizobium meliloti]UTG98649.1 trypsin-like peptidase domain-containing protein [Sinorhizobium meliloti]
MNKEIAFYLGAIVALFFLLLGWLFSTPEAIARFAAPDYLKTETTVVKVILKNGHGSAVAISKDTYLTAAHVARDGDAVTLQFADGRTCKATALWSSKAYDVALMRSEKCDGVQPATLSCRPLAKGEEIHIIGSPQIADNIDSWGRISSSKREIGPWKEAQYADVSVAGGNSGGPVFDKDGEVVGIVVGGLLANLGFSTTGTGWGILIPSQTICGLLAR